MFRTVLLVVALLSVSLFNTVFAADFKLGYVDFQRALNSVEEGKTAKTKLQKEFEAKQKEIEAKKAKLDALQKEITDLQQKAQSGLLKEADQVKGRKLEQDFQKGFQEYSQVVQQHQKDISEKEANATGDILRKLRSQIEDISRQGGYTVVLEKNEAGLVYAAEATDLTEKLIQKYNSTYKGGSSDKKN